jgi:hypothetical protein
MNYVARAAEAARRWRKGQEDSSLSSLSSHGKDAAQGNDPTKERISLAREENATKAIEETKENREYSRSLSSPLSSPSKGRDKSDRSDQRTNSPTGPEALVAAPAHASPCGPGVPSPLILDRKTLRAVLPLRQRTRKAIAEIKAEVLQAISQYRIEVATGVLGSGPILVRGYPLGLWLSLDVVASLLPVRTR